MLVWDETWLKFMTLLGCNVFAAEHQLMVRYEHFEDVHSAMFLWSTQRCLSGTKTSLAFILLCGCNDFVAEWIGIEASLEFTLLYGCNDPIPPQKWPESQK